MPVQRRLAAILAADVAGYSRLMGEDEEGTLAALTAHRTELIEPCIAEHRGRVVSTTGDGLLAEFASVVDAVSCAVAFQEGVAGAGASSAAAPAMREASDSGPVVVITWLGRWLAWSSAAPIISANSGLWISAAQPQSPIR